ncbi:restriction endonuclease subunit S [Silanimonas sp.]|jgi:type I restriction enzyme S subunit|uniref:restriction endonuclease subunit S n=1 Tax=Silanimonas sp. TaxID=1929290 RepID=UPI0037C7C7E2
MSEAKLKEVAQVVSGQHLLDGEHNTAGVGIGYLTGPSDFGREVPTISRWTESPKATCQRGDVLVTVKGAGVGKINHAPPETVAIGRQIMAVRNDPSLLDSRYLAAFLSGQLTHFRDRAVGATVPGLSRGDLEDLTIPLPALPVQRRIAARLDQQMAEVETARSAASLLKRDLSRFRAAIYRDAFRRGVPVVIPPIRTEAPKDWRWKTLSKLSRLESGHTPSRQRPEWWGGNVSWISLTEIRALDGVWVEETKIRTNAEGIANSAARILPRGTVCFSRTASVGFVTIMAKPMATSQDFANWVCGDQLDPEFLMHALIASRKSLREIATGATHKTIYMPALESFHVCMPKIDEQRRIVRRLKAQLAEADAIAKAAAEQLAEIERLPQRLLARAFGGAG